MTDAKPTPATGPHHEGLARLYANELGQALFVARCYVEAVESGTFLLDEGDDYALEVARGLLARQKEREEGAFKSAAAINARRDARARAQWNAKPCARCGKPWEDDHRCADLSPAVPRPVA